MLSESLKAVLTQRLIPRLDRKGMALSLEILIGNLSIANLIRDNKTFQIYSAMQMGRNLGMRLMDDSIIELLEAEEISLNDALANVENKLLLKRFMVAGQKTEIDEA